MCVTMRESLLTILNLKVLSKRRKMMHRRSRMVTYLRDYIVTRTSLQSLRK